MQADTFSLARVSLDGRSPQAAMVLGDRVIPLQTLAKEGHLALPMSDFGSVRTLLDAWDSVLPVLQALSRQLTGERPALDPKALGVPASTVGFLPPVDSPRHVFCIGANYRQHVIGLMLGDPDMRGLGREGVTDPAELRRLAEATMDERAAGGRPYAFIRFPDTLIGAHQSVYLPRDIQKPDWELELAVIIGRRARNIVAAEAMSCVAGYAIINDLTARERVFRKDMPAMGADWLLGKNWQDSAPFGPLFVPACFVKDPYDLRIQLNLNDRVMQDESTSDMVIRIDRQIEFLSSIIELQPGDVIATGSPAGNGSHYGVFLKPGDVMTGSITGLGQQRTACT